MTMKEFIDKMVADYGDAGLFAVETSCLTDDDLAKGHEHCLERVRPALEEEILCGAGEMTSNPFGSE